MIHIVLAPSRPPPTYRRFQTVRATAGDTVRLLSRLSPNISAPVREIRWFKGADCVKVFQISGGEEAAEETPSNGRDVSLTLYDVKVTDSGQYRCEMLGERKEDILFIHLHVSEFRLVFDSKDVGKPSRIQPLGYKSRERTPPDFRHHAFFGDATLPCYLSPETSAAAMEIRWFKGTDWIYLYQNGQVTEGRGYEGRVSLFTHELQKGNVSLRLRDTQESDSGRYRCVVTHGGRKVKTDVIHFTVAGTEKTFLRKVYVWESWVFQFLLVLSITGFRFSMIRRVLAPSRPPPTYRRFQTVRATAGDIVFLPCRLSPNISAPVREVRWFKGADCVEVFQISGGEETAEETPSNGRDVSLTLYDVKVTDSGQYRCEMLGEGKEDILFIHLHVSAIQI
ncbi:hypothetical protein NFI96_017647 [Prochilodus magdalenae]|nr:hypothetical protein NFI96_017647 [Prochilodus magdalenae]